MIGLPTAWEVFRLVHPVNAKVDMCGIASAYLEYASYFESRCFFIALVVYCFDPNVLSDVEGFIGD